MTHTKHVKVTECRVESVDNESLPTVAVLVDKLSMQAGVYI